MEEKQTKTFDTSVNSSQKFLLKKLTKASSKLEKCILDNLKTNPDESKLKFSCRAQFDKFQIVALATGLSLDKEPIKFKKTE